MWRCLNPARDIPRASPPHPAKSSALSIFAPFQLEREHWSPGGFFQISLDRTTDEPSDLHTLRLGKAIKFGLLCSGQSRGNALGVLTVFAHLETSAAFRGIPRQVATLPQAPRNGKVASTSEQIKNILAA
jgi:hypothetical protein